MENPPEAIATELHQESLPLIDNRKGLTVLAEKDFLKRLERQPGMNKPGGKEAKNLDRSLPRGRGKEVEFRSKKQKNELHIMKMSQEWDLRRQKRRLDRQKWVEERRNQKLPIWQRVGNLRVQVNEEILNEARNELVNKKQQIENSNESQQSRVTHEGKVKENLLESREKEIASAFRVPTSRLTESGTASETSFGVDQEKEAEINFIKIEQARTMEQPLLYNLNTLKTSKTSAQITEHCSITPVKSSSKPTGTKLEEEHLASEMSLEKDPEISCESEVSCATIKKLLRAERPRVDLSTNGEPEKADRKRKIDAISVDMDFREMPSLMRVDKPTTLESIERESGPVTISSSVNDSVRVISSGGRLDQTESVKGEAMPQIKQCYSLLDRRKETPNVNLFAPEKSPSHSTPVSVSTATSVTAPSEVKSHVALTPVSADPKCVVYLSNASASVPSPGAPSHPRPGYLVPVYKTSSRETAYAFLPTSAQRLHRAGDKSSLEGRSLNQKTDCNHACCTTISHYTSHHYPCPRSTTSLKEAHTACVPSTGKYIPCSQPPHVLHRDPIIQNTRMHSSYQTVNTAVKLNPSRTDSAYTNGGLTSGGSKNHVANIHYVPAQSPKGTIDHRVEHLKPETTSTRSTTPLAEEIRGAQTIPERGQPAFNRTPEVAPNQTTLNPQEAIFNPMSVYVRPKLVPREVVVVNHGAEPSPPLVEYIKTDAICENELTKWDAKHVADFIAATDCADKAEVFLEQEIDGKALLSLSPEMLMKGLNLKLGPSVKLYNHIANLRTALLL